MQQTFAAHGLLLVHFTIKSAVALGRTFVSIFLLVRFLLVLQIRVTNLYSALWVPKCIEVIVIQCKFLVLVGTHGV